MGYFGIDFTEMIGYYTPDGKLMFEGTHAMFLNYLNIGKHWGIMLEKEGKVIRRSLPVGDGDCAEYRTYEISPNSFNANYSRVYEVYRDGELVIRGSAQEAAKEIGVSKWALKNYLSLTKRTEKSHYGYKVYHVGYDFHKNLAV